MLSLACHPASKSVQVLRTKSSHNRIDVSFYDQFAKAADPLLRLRFAIVVKALLHHFRRPQVRIQRI